MNGERRWLYGLVLFVFLSFWAVHLCMTMKATRDASRLVLSEWAQATQKDVANNILLQARELDVLLGVYEEKGVRNIGDAQAVLKRLETGSGRSRSTGVMGRNGEIYDAGGALVARISQPVRWQTLKDGFYTTVNVFFPAEGRTDVAIAVPFSSNRNYYLVKADPSDAFAASLLKNVPIKNLCIGVFDEQGNLVFAKSGQSDTSDIQQSLLAGLSTFNGRENDVEIRKVGFGQTYDLYISLVEPAGWALGGRFEVEHLGSFHSVMLLAPAMIFVSLLFMFCVMIALDRINKKEMKKSLEATSRTDPVTGLANGAGVQDAIERFLKRHKGKDYSLVSLDIVAFHRFNTMFGYAAGDELLRTIGSVLEEHYHCGVRLNSDVFLLVAKTTPTMIDDLKARLREAIGRVLGGEYLQMLSFKFGVCSLLDSDRTFRTVHDGALLALKDAKKLPHQSEVVFGDDLQKRADFQKSVEMNMLHALSKEEFLVYIQPRCRVATGECCGGEALIRWQSEQLGFVYPDRFIPLFEQNGFIVEIDFFMLRSALCMLQNHLASGIRPYPVSVNLSKVTLTFPNYLERLENLMKRYPVPSEYIELEITESALEGDYMNVLTLLRAVKTLGFSIAMDDFGAGYSSLNTLRELPVNVLKIDKEFLRESDASERSRTIIRNIVNMSRDLSISVVCEGVETENQLAFLRSVGCDYAQGYYFAKPMPLVQYEETYIKPLSAVSR